MSFRTPAMERKYTKAKQSGDLRQINEEQPIEEFNHWIITENRFTHNKLAVRNHMLVLKRESNIEDITRDEWTEFYHILVSYCDERYDNCMLNFKSMRSVNNIPHVHLLNLKEQYK